MIFFINLLMFILISLTFVFMTICVPNEYTKINKRIDNLFANQRATYKYHLLSLLAHMRNSRTLAIMQEEYEIANSIQKNIETIEKELKVTMFAKANTLRQVGFRSSEASRLRPHGKPPRCFS